MLLHRLRTNMKLGLRLVLIALLVTALLSLAGCDSTDGGYCTFTERNEMCSFSFDYPPYYNQGGARNNLDYIRPYVAFSLIGPLENIVLIVPDPDNDTVGTVTSSYAPAYIEGMVITPKDDSSDAKSRLDSWISDLERWDNYELFERSSVTVSGIEGELIYYVVDWILLVPAGEGPDLKYVREVYFDYDGLIWKLKATSEFEMVDQVKADFEHILETFQILDN